MLSRKDKIEIFKQYVETKNGSYSDFMKDELYFYFFENGNDFDFLNSIETKIEIEQKTDFLISKMIMHEHEEGLNDIIYQYV